MLKLNGKLKRNFLETVFGAKKKVAGSFWSKIQHPTCRDNADGRNSSQTYFVDFLWWCDRDNSAQAIIAGFQWLRLHFHE